MCSAIDKTLVWENLDLEQLTDYAVAARYDDEFWPEQDVAADAVRQVERLREAILERLRL